MTNIYLHSIKPQEKRLLIFILLIMAVGCKTFANGDPVVRYSSINRVANPEPLTISEISIVHEQVNITHVDGYNCFDITYQFKNNSLKDFPEIHYGFPIDYLVDDEKETYLTTSDYISESEYEIGWNNKLIKDISFSFNNHDLEFHAAKESVRQAGFEVEVYGGGESGDSIPVDGINRRWFYTSFSMAPDTEATFNVRYKVYANSQIALYGDPWYFSQYVRRSLLPNIYPLNHPLLFRYFTSQFTILYDFSPATHFGNGKPFNLNIDIDLSNLEKPFILLEDAMKCYTSHISFDHYMVNPKNIDPINLSIEHSSPRDREHVERIIAPFIISPDKYKLRQSSNKIEIDFNEPTFVSELVCDLDTAIVKSINSRITYVDGRVEEYIYSQTAPETFDRKIVSPVILTITDLIHDGNLWHENTIINLSDDFDNPHFKIKTIKLDFNTVKASRKSSDSNYNIRVLDSRFY